MFRLILCILIIGVFFETQAQQTKDNALGIPLSQYPIQKIRVAIHVMQKEGEDPMNFSIEDTAFLAKQIFHLNANRQWPQILEPNPYNVPMEDIRIRFVLDTITFFKNDHWWDFGNVACGINPDNCGGTCRSKTDSLHKFYIMDNDAFNDTMKNNTFHIFYVGNTGPKKCFDGEAESLNTSKWLVMRFQHSIYKAKVQNYEWNLFLLLNHEISHGFGMMHPFQMKACCYEGLTKKGTTNNVMDYFPSGGASISPCQGLLMHTTIIKTTKSPFCLNKALIADCDYDNTYSIFIPSGQTYTYESNWLVQMKNDIIIEKDATLIVKGNLYMPSFKGKIILKKNASLIVDGGSIGNRCNEKWDGIYFENKNKNKKLVLKENQEEYIFKNSKVKIIENGKILDMKTKTK